MEVKIELLEKRMLIGMRLNMSFSNNRTGELWGKFMRRRHEIPHCENTDLISMQLYPKLFDFSPGIDFEKWAAVEVSGFNEVPDEMETFILPGGLYAVFHYKGSSLDHEIFHYIFTDWLPNANYQLDERPYFEILGAKYKNADPDSEEDIYIPIKEKIVSRF